LLLLAGGMLSAGMLYAILLDAVHVASFSIASLRPAIFVPAAAVLRIGFAMGLTNFGLWALAFVFPFALEDARFRALRRNNFAPQPSCPAALPSRAPLPAQHAQRHRCAGDRGPERGRRLLAALGDCCRLAPRPGACRRWGTRSDWLRHYRTLESGTRAASRSLDIGAGRAWAPPRLLPPAAVETRCSTAPGARERRPIDSPGEVVDREEAVCTVEDNGWECGREERPGASAALGAAAAALQYAERGQLPARIFLKQDAVDLEGESRSRRPQ